MTLGNYSGTYWLAGAVLTAWLAGSLGGGSFAIAFEEVSEEGVEKSYSQSDRNHWSFRPIKRHEVPQFTDAADQQLVESPIDAFILQRLRQDGLTLSPRANRRTLIRRLSFDLAGLPPTPERVQQFLDDDSPDAWSRLVDETLSNPTYGEKWGQHWLDVVRFAESEGFEYDRHHKEAWRFRDFVIRAFNENLPFNEFATLLIAGDEVASEMTVASADHHGGTQADRQRHDALIAVGFHRLGPVRRNAGNPEIAFSRNEVLTEMTNAVGTVFLGLTVGCARCHDHFFDPFKQTDYYRLQAFLAATQEHDAPLTDDATFRKWQTEHDAISKRIYDLKNEIGNAEEPRRTEISNQIAELNRQLPEALPTIFSVTGDPKRRTPIHLLARGDETKPLEALGMRFPGVLIPDDEPEFAADSDHPKTRLARWIASEQNPLTARVFVNRVWQFHFGRGLVETANDFGVNGEWPTHPELLDWLAHRFIASDWDVKALHRLILNSSVWQQSSEAPTDGATAGLAAVLQVDPLNRLLGRFSRRRLTAEELRDSILQVSGSLNPRRTGPSVLVPVAPELTALLYKPAQWEVTSDPFEHNRRTIYLIAKRNLRLPFMEVFDQPDLQISCARRESSTHSPQALELLNGEFATIHSATFAERLRRECGTSLSLIVDQAFELSTGQLPTSKQRAAALRFLEDSPLEEFSLAVLNLNGFLYVE
jgi:hypothetical protein